MCILLKHQTTAILVVAVVFLCVGGQQIVQQGCTNCSRSESVFTFNSTTHQSVNTTFFGPDAWLVNSTAGLLEMGFTVGFGTQVYGYCPSSGSNHGQCVDQVPYCLMSPPFRCFQRPYYAYMDIHYVVPVGVAGIRLKLHEVFYWQRSHAVVQLNGVTIWTASCVSCPSIISVSVHAGDRLMIREEGSAVALYWMETWQHTAWPTRAFRLSPGNMFIRDVLCATCPTGLTGYNCLPIPAPTAPPTRAPSLSPTRAPTASTTSPTHVPTALPTTFPTLAPITGSPTVSPPPPPTAAPMVSRTGLPTSLPTLSPTANPTNVPSAHPTAAPTAPTTATPTLFPSALPTAAPTSPTSAPAVGGTDQEIRDDNGSDNNLMIYIIPIVGVLVVVLIAVIIKRRRSASRKSRDWIVRDKYPNPVYIFVNSDKGGGTSTTTHGPATQNSTYAAAPGNGDEASTGMGAGHAQTPLEDRISTNPTYDSTPSAEIVVSHSV
eukprot:m.119480 g.119480  ORF g.119480 m.119480 type:complete len:490 (+) comp11019_c1_seq3:128-1597(+)